MIKECTLIIALYFLKDHRKIRRRIVLAFYSSWYKFRIPCQVAFRVLRKVTFLYKQGEVFSTKADSVSHVFCQVYEDRFFTVSFLRRQFARQEGSEGKGRHECVVPGPVTFETFLAWRLVEVWKGIKPLIALVRILSSSFPSFFLLLFHNHAKNVVRPTAHVSVFAMTMVLNTRRAAYLLNKNRNREQHEQNS